MFLTLIVMIFATPIVFDKLMNSKFNAMLVNLQQQRGITIKEIKNKSNYLTTDRIFEIIIPGAVINQKEIKYIKLLTEVKFKNLPVTEVLFHNIVKKLVLKNNEDIKFLENKFIFNVITPDFKHFRYKVLNNSVQENGVTISWKDFNGIYVYLKEFKNEDGNIEIKNNRFKVLFNHIFVDNLFLKNKIEQESKLQNIMLKFPTININIQNINSKNIQINKNSIVDILSNFYVKEINSSIFKLNSAKLNIHLKHLNKNALLLLQKGENKGIANLLNDGFDGIMNLNIKNIFFIKPLGFLSADVNFSIKKGAKNYQKLQNNDLSFLALNAKIEASPKIGSVVALSYPIIAPFIKVKNNKAIISIQIKKGKIYINGTEIKSY